jgi:DNA modification methylase
MSNQQDLGFAKPHTNDGPVECLGMTFDSELARRAYFIERLREKLQDPDFRELPGFPVGSDEDILRLSDPPYYTACPNPFWVEVAHQSPVSNGYERDPFVTDVEVGKNDPIYNAHSYHTKVPHQAIQQYIEHYTSPGDVVLDPFCGSGMTGVACAELAQPRRALICDLSPAASNIAFNYSAKKDKERAALALGDAVARVSEKLGWMYKTRHTGWPSSDRQVRHDRRPGRSDSFGDVEFVIWSDVFRCAECTNELVFWNAAASFEAAGLLDEFACPSCSVLVGKKGLERVWETKLDEATGAPQRSVRRCPVLIQYRFGTKTFHKLPDEEDLKLIAETDNARIGEWFPTVPLHDGDKTSDPKSVGITHAHHFYTRRNLAVLAAMWAETCNSERSTRPALQFLFTSTMAWATRMNRLLVSNFFKKRGGVIGQTLSGTLYVSSVSIETNPLYRFSLREKSAMFTASGDTVFVSTQSATDLTNIPDGSVDYIFTDPPFGHNLAYSDLNFLWESWLGVRTNIEAEAVISSAQRKSLGEYEALMSAAFAECFRVLKPNRWITVEFHNTRNSVWRAIQQALGAAGFVVSNVSILNKTHGTFNQVTAAGAVSKDLAITAYRPSVLVERALEGVGPEVAWAFVREHLAKLPVLAGGDAVAEPVAERTAQMLLDRMIAFHVQRGISVPLSGPEFLQGLAQRFPERDAMYFLPDQVAEYDRKWTSVSELRQLSLFVNDEASAIQWVRQQLQDKPHTFQDLQPQFMRELQAWAKHEETVELKTILEQSFLHYDGRGPVPSQIHRYLSTNYKDLRNLEKDDPRLVEKARDRWYVPDPNKQAEREAVREKSLLREFDEYKTSTQRKLKVFRTEAVRVGFKACWQERDYGTIVKVAEKLPDAVLQEDEKLLMYYDNALTRLGDE